MGGASSKDSGILKELVRAVVVVTLDHELVVLVVVVVVVIAMVTVVVVLVVLVVEVLVVVELAVVPTAVRGGCKRRSS